MARQPWDSAKPTVESQPQRLEVSYPETVVPTDAEKWLRQLGWQSAFLADQKVFWKPDTYDSLHMEWHEAVAMEYIRFMTLGAVGNKKPNIEVSGTAESPARFG